MADPARDAEDIGLALDADDLDEMREAMRNPDAVVTDTPNDQKLRRFSVVCVIVNRMIGSGIFVTPSTIVRGTDSVAVALIFWVIGCVMTFMAISVYLELGLSIPKYRLRGGDAKVSVPRSGGELNYLEYIFKRPKYLATCVYAVIFICIGNTAGNGISFSENFLHMCAVEKPSAWLIKGVAIAIITLACFLHGFWRAGGIYFNNILASLKVAVLLVVIGAGLAAFGGVVDTATENAFESDPAPFAPSDTYGYAGAFLAVMFSYGGSMNAHYVLSEVHRPQETLKKAAYTAVGLVSFLYILTNIAYFGVISKSELGDARGTTFVATTFFRKVFGSSGAAGRVLPGLVALSSLGNIIVVTFVASRVKAEIAKAGVIPFSKFFAASTPTLLTRIFRPKSGIANDDVDHHHMRPPVESTPAGALLLHWVFSVIIIAAPPIGDTYTFFVNLYSYTISTWIGAFLAGGLLWLRWRPRSTWVSESSFRPWGGPTMALVFLVFNVFLIVAPFIPPAPNRSRLSMKSIQPFIFPTIGTSLFLVGGLYWVGFRFAWPKIYRRELQQTRIPILLDGVQVHEIVICSWVVPGSPSDDSFDMEECGLGARGPSPRA